LQWTCLAICGIRLLTHGSISSCDIDNRARRKRCAKRTATATRRSGNESVLTIGNGTNGRIEIILTRLRTLVNCSLTSLRILGKCNVRTHDERVCIGLNRALNVEFRRISFRTSLLKVDKLCRSRTQRQFRRVIVSNLQLVN
jgi:hypothetical protein